MVQSHPAPVPAAIEHLDILIVGAGLSGIDAAYRVQTGSPNRSFGLFEARDAIGGTWDLFRYPGVRSDSDMTTLGFPFRPWSHEKSIADGADILGYIEETARQFGIDRKIRLRHRVAAAAWSSATARWTVDYEHDGRCAQISCDFLFLCSGYYDYSQGHTPSWPGMAGFAGRIVHPQFWPEDLDVAGKRVVVVGSGATAVTLVPALAKLGAASVTMLQRSPSYIVSVPAYDRRAISLRRWLPASLADGLIRWKNIAFGIFSYTFARHSPERMKRMIATGQRRALGPEFEMAHFTPRYDPWDQRLCLVPDADLFKAIRSGTASIATDEIASFEEHGLLLASGKSLAADIVVSATGLAMKLMGGATLTVDGAPVNVSRRMLYKGAMLEGVPNFAFAVGYTNASWTLKCDLTARFVSRLVNHMARRSLSSVVPVADHAARANEPMLDLKSGYIERAAAILPRQGMRAPWRVHQNYARDLLAFRTGRLADGVLRFTKGRAHADSRKDHE